MHPPDPGRWKPSALAAPVGRRRAPCPAYRALPDFTTSSHIPVARGWLIRTTGRLRPGRSWPNCRCSRDGGITGNSRRDPLNTSSRMRHCQEFPGTQAQPQPAFRDPAGAPWIGPREATDRHDQHKPTQPAPGWRDSETVLREQKPQVKGHITGSRDRTRTYNLPVNSRTLCRLSYAGSTRIRVAHLRRACDAHGAWWPALFGARPGEYPRVIGEGHVCT